ncbi:uncharacterized protein V2V93DRAFT_372030 [Kockiozyma suomiensis]|uniref:uncharacterized protein n=1 Tax=Kockiozyma suomiensis TaxID=1337062 RepID=UPI0033437A61
MGSLLLSYSTLHSLFILCSLHLARIYSFSLRVYVDKCNISEVYCVVFVCHSIHFQTLIHAIPHTFSWLGLLFFLFFFA